MASQSFQTIQLNTNPTASDINRIQANIQNAVSGLVGPFSGGVLLTSKSIATVATVLTHSLGRVPTIWIICDQDTETQVKRTAWDKTTITLEAAASCIVSVWVS